MNAIIYILTLIDEPS